MMEVCTTVMATTDYKMFSFIEGNRKVNSTNLNQIIQSMKEKQLIIPILVNEKMQIIDGQHRFSACEYLKLPVYFIIQNGYGVEEVIRANVNGGRKWYDSDYLNKYCLLKDDRYLKIKKITEDFEVNLHDFLKLLATIQSKKINVTKREFREGKVNLLGVELLTTFLTNLEDFKKFRHYKSSNFISAFTRLYFREDYQHSHMVKKFNTNYPNLTKQTSSNDYLATLCNKIYSFGTVKLPIYFSSESNKFHQ